jgi:hypothetical protein
LQVQINEISEKRKVYSVRMKESLAQGKEAAAQHIAAEV